MEKAFEEAKRNMKVPYVAFKHEHGFVVMAQEHFNSLSKRKRTKLLAPVLKKEVKK